MEMTKFMRIFQAVYKSLQQKLGLFTLSKKQTHVTLTYCHKHLLWQLQVMLPKGFQLLQANFQLAVNCISQLCLHELGCTRILLQCQLFYKPPARDGRIKKQLHPSMQFSNSYGTYKRRTGSQPVICELESGSGVDSKEKRQFNMCDQEQQAVCV